MASTSDLKEKLMRNLYVIRTANYALKFCNSLIEAQRVKNKLCRFVQPLPSHEQMFDEIKNNLNCVPAERLMKIILKVLHAPKEKECQEKQQLLNILLKPTSEAKSEYLNQLIRAVESLVTFFSFPELYNCCLDLKVEDHNKPLVSLREFLLNYGRYKTEKLLYNIFWLGINKYDFSWEEKEEIRDIVIEAMPHIATLIKKLCFDFEYTIGIASLKQRSSLQFIKDLLTGFSSEHKSIKEFIDNLDEVIETCNSVAVWCGFTPLDYCNNEASGSLVDDSNEDASGTPVDDSTKDSSGTLLDNPNEDAVALNDEDIVDKCFFETIDDYNKAGGCQVPKEHTWWQAYKRANFKSSF